MEQQIGSKSFWKTFKNKIQNSFSSVDDSSSSYTNKLKNYISKLTWIDWVAWLGFMIFTVATAFTVVDIVNYLIKGQSWKVLFGTLDRFTNESNLLLWIYMIFYLFFPKHSFMKNNKFLIWNMAYIFFTFFGYNVILVGFNGYSYSGSMYDITSNVWWHALSPIYYLFFGFSYMWAYKGKQPKYWSTLITGMIYPTIYVIYVITIPYTFTPPNDLSNFYADFITSYPDGHYTVYGSATNVVDYWTAWIYIMVIWVIFFPGSYTFAYWSWKWMNKNPSKFLRVNID